MTATQCETKRGNSGAPAVDEAGSVRGVLFGVLPPEISNANRYKSFETPTQFKVMSFITNAACIDLPTGVAAHGKRADLDVCNRRLSAKDLVQRSMHDTNSGLESQLKLWIPSAPPMLTFHIQPIKSQLSNTGLPLVTCVKNISTWLPKEKSIPQGLENFSSVGSTIQLRYRAPIFSLKAALDEHYRVYSKPATIDYALVDLSFDEADLNTNGHTTVSESIGSEGGALKPTTARQDLKICL